MTTAHLPRRRRLLPVTAGFLAVVTLTTITDVLLHAIGVFPPWGDPMADSLFVLALGYRIGYAILGGYLAARLAQDRPVAHALVLGLIGFVLAVAGAVATAGRGPAFGPTWYSVLVCVSALPASLAGARLLSQPVVRPSN